MSYRGKGRSSALLTRIALLLGAAVAAFAQPLPYTCTGSTPNAPTIRMEGITELVGDILLTCNGGSPTPNGQQVALTTITLTFNANLTSRILANGASEAMLLIDEPTSASNPNTPQLACATPIEGCSIVGNGGNNLYSGAAGHPNIFQAQQISPTTLAWYNLPLDAPGQTAARIVRITNVRVNANALAVSNLLQPPAVQATISITGAENIGLAGPMQTVANLAQGLETSVAGTAFLQCGSSPFSAGLYPTTASVTLTEGFAGAFRQMSYGANGNTTLAAWLTSGATGESGFIPASTSGVPTPAGAAAAGTEFTVALAPAIPAQITATVPATVNLLDAKQNVVGSADAVVSTGTTGVVAINVTVTSVTPSATVKSLTIPVTFSGNAPQLPLTISATPGFLTTPFPQVDLFAIDSPSYNSIPVFGTLDSGISTPPESLGQTIASVVDCTQTTANLGTNNQPLPVFQQSGPVAPLFYNVPIVSSGPSAEGLQVNKDPSATWLNATLNSTTTPATLILSANSFSPSTTLERTTTLQVTASGAVGQLALGVTFTAVTGPWFTRYGYKNSASYVDQAVAPGEPFLIGGYNFGTVAEANLTVGSNGFVETTLADTQVLFDNQPAPLQFVVQIDGVGYAAGYAPFELAGKSTTNVQVVNNNVASPPVTLNVTDAVPAIFTANTSGGGQGAILNQDFSVNGQGNAANPGDMVYIYGGGAGQTTPAGRTGGVAGVGAPLAALNLPVTVFIDGVQAPDVAYAGPAPQLIEGVFQVNVQIPPNARGGALPVVIQVGDKVTQPGVTVYVK